MATSFSYKTLDASNLWDITKGMGVNAPNTPPDQNGKLINGANASLTYNGNMIGLWVNNINTDFALNGTTGQGPFNQVFYPHNLNTPTLAISGQTTNARQKNRLADFIRWTHSQIIKRSSNNPSTLIAFQLYTKGQYNTRTQKGSPSPFAVYGYIDNIPIGAAQFTTAYSYQFNFNIAYTTNNASGTTRFMSLQFTPSSVKQLQDITQWATDPTNQTIFEKPDSNTTINSQPPKQPIGTGVLAPNNFTPTPANILQLLPTSNPIWISGGSKS